MSFNMTENETIKYNTLHFKKYDLYKCQVLYLYFVSEDPEFADEFVSSSLSDDDFDTQKLTMQTATVSDKSTREFYKKMTIFNREAIVEPDGDLESQILTRTCEVRHR